MITKKQKDKKYPRFDVRIRADTIKKLQELKKKQRCTWDKLLYDLINKNI